MESPPADVVALVTRRRALLDALREGPASKPDLVAALDVSRSTVDRGVRELESAALVRRAAGTVRLTTPGRLCLRAHDRLHAATRGVDAARGLLEDLPAGSVPDPVLFEGATVVEGTQAVPSRPLEVVSGYLEDAERVHAVSLSVVPRMVEQYRRAVTEDGTDVTMVVPEGVLSRLLEAHEDALAAVLEAGASLHQVATEPPYGVLAVDRPSGPVAALLVHGDGGLRGLVANDDPLAVAWARSYVQGWVDRATPL